MRLRGQAHLVLITLLLPASLQSGVATSSSPYQSHSHGDKKIAALLTDPEQDHRVNMPARLGED
jgi:hypothetical protein